MPPSGTDPDLEALLTQARALRDPKERANALTLLGQAAAESEDEGLQTRGRDALAEAADAGQPEAAWFLAYLCFDGIGGPADPDTGIACLAQAAENGVSQAAFELGQLLARAGQHEASREWLSVAAVAGVPGAQRQLGRLAASEGKDEEALSLLGSAAAGGDARAGYELVILLAQVGPTDSLLRELDALLVAGRPVPVGVLGEVGRALAARDPDAVFNAVIPVTTQSLPARQAFLVGLERGNPELMQELGEDISAVLDLG